uniref:hypothetical protein n=1 Tax=Streptococcus pneumoniae TaxID=1313 RepID=UPI0035563DC3
EFCPFSSLADFNPLQLTKSHKIKVFEHLILCVFLILKIFPRLFYTFNISPTHGDWCDFPEYVGTSFPYPTW